MVRLTPDKRLEIKPLSITKKKHVMKKTIKIIMSTLLITSTMSTPAIANNQDYAPCTFNDFDDNCKAAELITTQSFEQAAMIIKTSNNKTGEPGW